jgi:hypothetical protein
MSDEDFFVDGAARYRPREPEPMAKAFIHAESSARKFGGRAEDYFPIHDFLDASKAALADNRHRALTHNAWFLSVVLPRVFGDTITNSEGRKVSVKDVGEQHVLEDYGMRFIPTAQDFLALIPWEGWMDNGRSGHPASHAKIAQRSVKKVEISLRD